MTKVYVHDGAEVVLTGRIAKKKLRRGNEITVHEIEPADKESIKFKKWVHMKELFEIMGDDDEQN